MSKKTIVVCDHIHQDGLDILANDSEIEFINAADEPKDKLIAEIIPLADVAITRSSTDVDDAFLASGPFHEGCGCPFYEISFLLSILILTNQLGSRMFPNHD